jgi:hypothetical protein
VAATVIFVVTPLAGATLTAVFIMCAHVFHAPSLYWPAIVILV